MTCGHCDPSEKEKKDQYKCKSCDSTSDGEAGKCCGAPREKMCSCGSDKFAKECCKT